MKDVFIIDNSLFEDAFTDEGRAEFKQSSKEFINQIFRLKLDGIDAGYIPEKAYNGFVSFFKKIERTNTILLISQIFNIEPPAKSNENSTSESIQNLAYRFTLIPRKAYLVTNNQKIFEEVLKSQKMFYVVNSTEALKIINHENFSKK